MNINSRNKLIKAGWKIIRKDDYPEPRIKIATGQNGAWRTLEKYKSKAERDRMFTVLLSADKTIDE
jgi:hypothetical protein